MQALVHGSWKHIANDSDYVEKQCFVAENLLHQTVLVLFVSVAVSMEINRRQYFWGNLHTLDLVSSLYLKSSTITTKISAFS